MVINNSRWIFNVDGINEKRLFRKDRFIPYSTICAIIVCTAVNSYFFPFYNKGGTPKNAIEIYDSIHLARFHIRPNAISVLPKVPGNGVLTNRLFTNDDFKVLLEKTNATVFFSETAYTNNKDALANILHQHKDRIYVSVAKDSEQIQHVLLPYSNLKT